MIPGYGPDCDLCTPSVHYALTCPKCGHWWDEIPCFDTFKCAVCGEEVEVTREDHEAWLRDVLGL